MAQWFKEYENYPIVEKSQIKWNFTKDFEVQSKYIVQDISALIKKLENADDKELLRISEHCYNLLSWTRQMAIMGFTGFQKYIDDLLLDNFGDKEIIIRLQGESFKRWLKGKEGNQKVGENYFVLYEGKIYYKKLIGKWYVVEEESVFNLMPNMHLVKNESISEALSAAFELSPYHRIYSEWEEGEYAHDIPAEHFAFSAGESTPEEQLDKAVSKIRQIIANPVSLAAVKGISQLDSERLEYLIKLSCIMAQFVQGRRRKGEHTVYLLRDCLIFYEMHKTLDIIEDSPTSSDQLIAGRKLLSNKKRVGGHWYFCQEALFFAYEKHPQNFEDFYKEFSKILSEYEEYSEEFLEFIKKLADYVDTHIPANLSTDTTIDIIDLGFQGSINILMKYVIDKHCRAGRNHETVIHMYVLAEWFKSVYPGAYSSETYSLLTNIEVLARNELLYDYKLGSFAEGAISVVMGSKEEQEVASTELIVTTMVPIITHNLKLV